MYVYGSCKVEYTNVSDIFSNLWPFLCDQVMEIPKCLKELRQQRIHLVYTDGGTVQICVYSSYTYIGKARLIWASVQLMAAVCSVLYNSRHAVILQSDYCTVFDVAIPVLAMSQCVTAE